MGFKRKYYILKQLQKRGLNSSILNVNLGQTSQFTKYKLNRVEKPHFLIFVKKQRK